MYEQFKKKGFVPESLNSLFNLNDHEAFILNTYLDLVPEVTSYNILYYLDSLYNFSKDEKRYLMKIILDSDKLIKEYVEKNNTKNKKNSVK